MAVVVAVAVAAVAVVEVVVVAVVVVVVVVALSSHAKSLVGDSAVVDAKRETHYGVGSSWEIHRPWMCFCLCRFLPPPPPPHPPLTDIERRLTSQALAF